MNQLLVAASAAAVVASAATADVTFSLTNFRIEGSELTRFAGEGDLDGVLTGATINIVMTAWTNYTYADDLCIYLNTSDQLTLGGALQIGGTDRYDAEERYTIPAQQRRSMRHITFASPINVSNDELRLWIGNSYGGGTTTGTWNGTITLHGLTGVPSPGPLALLAAAGVIGKRRRR